MTMSNKVLRYVQAQVKDSDADRTQVMNIIRTFQASLIEGSSVTLEFELAYDNLQPSYNINFFTKDRYISSAILYTLTNNRQVADVTFHPESVYGPGYVQVVVEKLSSETRKRKPLCSTGWKLKAVPLDGIPEMSDAWATDVDRDIVREILEFTYGMYEEMPIVTARIIQRDKERYDILCENIPAVAYGFIKAIEKQFPTYIQQICVNVERSCLRYTLRLNSSPMRSVNIITDCYDSDDSRDCKRRKLHA